MSVAVNPAERSADAEQSADDKLRPGYHCGIVRMALSDDVVGGYELIAAEGDQAAFIRVAFASGEVVFAEVEIVVDGKSAFVTIDGELYLLEL